MVQYHLACRDTAPPPITFWADVMLVVVLLTQGELCSPLLSSSSIRLITWHSTRNQMTSLDVNFGCSIPPSKYQPSIQSA